MKPLGNDWDDILQNEFQKPYYQKLREILKTEYRTQTIYPPMEDIYHCLRLTSYQGVKAVIVGQDPYHGEGQAHGLSFSVKKGVKIPPSLKNMYKELQSDVGFLPPQEGDLTLWAERGVLLLNTSLTVRAHSPNSHKDIGWRILTDAIITKLNERSTPIVFFLWGANARAKKTLLTNQNHLILETVHPSPLSAYNGFFGCRHFSKCNAFLGANGISPIDWQL